LQLERFKCLREIAEGCIHLPVPPFRDARLKRPLNIYPSVSPTASPTDHHHNDHPIYHIMTPLKGPGEGEKHDGSALRIAIVHARWNMTVSPHSPSQHHHTELD
jgi:hypothetical protein